MKIAMINGSPKLGQSNSEAVLKRFEPFLEDQHQIIHYNLSKQALTVRQYEELCEADALVLAFPLYIDAIPSHLFRMMVELETYLRQRQRTDLYVYAIINNGFYEGQQNHIAAGIVKNWCQAAGVSFGMAIGQGAGEMIGFMEHIPVGHGPIRNLGRAMKRLADCIQSRDVSRKQGEVLLFNPNYPRFAWKITANRAFWHPRARKNGLKPRDLKKRS